MQQKIFSKNGSIILCILISYCTAVVQSAKAQTARPNIVIILTDDMVYHSLSINTNDPLIQTPNIDRIGEEGADIKYYCTNSLCVPGRASLLSGKYGHTTGAVNNANYPPDSLVTLPKILHAKGYHTALIGKWMMGNWNPKPEFDYWLASHNQTTYYNDSCNYSWVHIPVNEHMTDFETDSALALISRIDTPFFILISYNAPHLPFVPQIQYNGMFDTCDFEVPQNFERYTINYPSFLYSYGYNIPSENIYQYQKRKYSELFKGVDISTGKIYQSLQALGLLDNTMLIFTTDNSNLIGEHGLFSKLHPYDECMHLPLLIRYPPWYLPGTIMNSNFLLNIDITPTILDVAGITDSFRMEGTSARQFANGTKWRKEFLYEQYADSNESPFTVKTFRDEFFQYNRYFCYDTTEELFDMITDPLQKTNLVHHFKYMDTLTEYRIKLDSLRSLEGDTAFIPLTPCYLLNPSFPLSDSVFNNQLLIEPDFFIYPNPVNNFLTIYCNEPSGYFELKDILGRTLSNFTMNSYDSGKKIITVSDLCNGNYIVEGSTKNLHRIKKFIVVK